jgi:acetyl esterase/lipase
MSVFVYETKENRVFHGRPSVQTRVVNIVLPYALKPVLKYTPIGAPTLLFLKAVDKVAGFFPDNFRVVTREIDTGDWSAQIVTPKIPLNKGVILYFHGGAFISCGLGTHKRFVETLALSNSMPVMSVAYRQYPKGNYDTALIDCLEAFQWLVDEGYSPEDIILAGDSAGGGLAMKIAGDLLAKEIKVKCVICISPWIDFDHSAKLLHRWSKEDAYIPAKRLEEIARKVLGRTPDHKDSPISSLEENYPPLLMITGANEILRVDIDRAFDLCEELKIPCELHYFRGGVHAFPILVDVFPESDEALEIIRTFITKVNVLELVE